MEKVLPFYRDVLGMEISREFDIGGNFYEEFVNIEGAKANIVFLELEGCEVELVDYLHPEGKDANSGYESNDHGVAHFCFEVDDIAEVYEKVDSATKTVSEPLDYGDSELFYAVDPDGNKVEFIEN